MFILKLSKLWNLRHFLNLSESFCAYVVASYTSRQETVFEDDSVMNGLKTFITDELL